MFVSTDSRLSLVEGKTLNALYSKDTLRHRVSSEANPMERPRMVRTLKNGEPRDRYERPSFLHRSKAND
jgi:hypothetical protein